MRLYFFIAPALALCAGAMGIFNRAEPMEEVKFSPGMKLEEISSGAIYKDLSSRAGNTDEPVSLEIMSPHLLTLIVGSELIQFTVGGDNSQTRLTSGFRPGGFQNGWKGDYKRFGALHSDVGAGFLTRKVAKALATDLCSKAEKGIKKKSRIDPTEVIDSNNIPPTDRIKFSGRRVSEVCFVENDDLAFLIRYSGPDNFVGREYSQNEPAVFKLHVSLYQAIPKP